MEAVETVLSNSSKVMIDVEGGNNLMYLPLDQLMRNQNAVSIPRINSDSELEGAFNDQLDRNPSNIDRRSRRESPMNKLQVSLVFVLLAAALLWSAAFTVHQTETAIKLQFGRLVKSDYKPGLHFKVPTPFVDTVFKFDKRILTLENNSPDRALTSEKKNVIVDSFAKWRINDVEVYFKKTGGDERRAETLLSQFIKKGCARRNW